MDIDDSNITTFQRITSIPDIEEFTSANIISTNDSAYPIYAWYDNGIIKYYSESENIKANTDMSGMFEGLTALTSIGNLSSLDTTNVGYMQGMFQGCSSLTDLATIADWNVSNVTNMQWMFGFSGITNLTGLTNWNVFNVRTMDSMFSGCTSLSNASGINDWNVVSVDGYIDRGTGTMVINETSNGFIQMFKNAPSHPTFSKRAGTWDADGTFTPSA